MKKQIKQYETLKAVGVVYMSPSDFTKFKTIYETEFNANWFRVETVRGNSNTLSDGDIKINKTNLFGDWK